MIITYTGRYFDYHNITKESIHIDDIAHSLARQTRYLAHTMRSYTVGEHTLRGLMIASYLNLSTRQHLYWLIHDFTEAYVGDCPSPLKKLLPAFQEIEGKVAEAILEYAGLPPMTEEEERIVHMIDRTMLVLEMRELTHHDPAEYMNDVFHEIIEDPNFMVTKYHFDETYINYAIRNHYNELLKAVKGNV